MVKDNVSGQCFRTTLICPALSLGSFKNKETVSASESLRGTCSFNCATMSHPVICEKNLENCLRIVVVIEPARAGASLEAKRFDGILYDTSHFHYTWELTWKSHTWKISRSSSLAWEFNLLLAKFNRVEAAYFCKQVTIDVCGGSLSFTFERSCEFCQLNDSSDWYHIFLVERWNNSGAKGLLPRLCILLMAVYSVLGWRFPPQILWWSIGIQLSRPPATFHRSYTTNTPSNGVLQQTAAKNRICLCRARCGHGRVQKVLVSV